MDAKETVEKPYRSNVGVVVFNDRGEVLTGERIQYPGVFQFPQGGMDEGEEPLEAARRELYEEVGLRLLDRPAGEIRDWLYYEFPEDIPPHLKRYRGQKQKWFFFHWNGDPDSLSLDHHEQEFESLRWSDLDRVAREIVGFKKDVYAILAREGQRIIRAYLKER